MESLYHISSANKVRSSPATTIEPGCGCMNVDGLVVGTGVEGKDSDVRTGCVVLANWLDCVPGAWNSVRRKRVLNAGSHGCDRGNKRSGVEWSE